MKRQLMTFHYIGFHQCSISSGNICICIRPIIWSSCNEEVILYFAQCASQKNHPLILEGIEWEVLGWHILHWSLVTYSSERKMLRAWADWRSRIGFAHNLRGMNKFDSCAVNFHSMGPNRWDFGGVDVAMIQIRCLANPVVRLSCRVLWDG